MKKLSFLTLAFVISFGAAIAQNTDDDKAHKPMRTAMAVKPRFGIKAGGNMASLERDDESINSTEFKTTGKTSAHFGLLVNIPLGGTLRLQPEIVYSGQGSKYNPSRTTTPDSTHEIDLHYLNIPLMFQLQSPGGFYGEVGPQVGFLVNAERDYNVATIANPDIKDEMKKIDFAVGVGVGYLTRIGLGIGARYNHGLTNVYNTDDAPARNKGLEYSTRTLQFGLTYHFGAAK